MIEIIINPLELEKIKSKVTTTYLTDFKCTGYKIDNIFIGSRLDEKFNIEYIDHFNNSKLIIELLDKYFIRYQLQNIIKD